MKTEQIEITHEVYNLLNKEQVGDESYSEVILRMAAELAEYRDEGLLDKETQTESADNRQEEGDELPEDKTDSLPEDETEHLPEDETKPLPEEEVEYLPEPEEEELPAAELSQ